MSQPNDKGVILITSLWIVAILSLFAVTVGRQASISLKLASYETDKRKAFFTARAGIMRALAEKRMEYVLGMSAGIDALSQAWANNESLFRAHAFGPGYYTVSYEYPGLDADGKKPATLYGLMDEQSKININTAVEDTLRGLFMSFIVDEEKALSLAGSIIDWRDADSITASSEKGLLYGAENEYYTGLNPPYECKNAAFDSIYELLLVRGMDDKIFRMIKPYITVYGNGMVNINTAGERVLSALIGEDFPELASKINRYRQGEDGIIGTKDDAWFGFGPEVVDRREDGLVEIKNLQDPDWYANIYSITTDEYNRIRELLSIGAAQICVASDVYRVSAVADVDGVKSRLEAVYMFSDKKNFPTAVFWYQE
ncbi:MAG: type II secretion system protein GspK [Candidatus Omnitrophica bacterium]|nr:type II secretion system protein GspK [Candidatus Omnitrophota bacterium]